MNQRMAAPPLTPTNKIILIILATSFITYSFFLHVLDIPLTMYLGLSLPMVSDGFIYQFITYPFITRGIFELLFNGLLIWFLGYDLEYRWGRRNYILFMVISILSSGIFYLLFNYLLYQGTAVVGMPLLGIAGLCSSLLLAYAFIYPDREFAFMLIFPIKAKYFVMLLILMELYFSSVGPNKAASLSHLVALAVSSMFLIYYLREQNNLWRFNVKKIASVMPKKKNHLSLVDEKEKKDNPKYWH